MTRSRRTLATLLLGALALGLLGWRLGARAPVAPPAQIALEASAKGAPVNAAKQALRGAPSSSGAPSLGPNREVLARRLERAEDGLQAYLESSQYPPSSRPIAERPDLREPHRVPVRKLPLARGKVNVVLGQDRYYLTGDESVALTISCEDAAGPTPCSPTAATAHPPPDMQQASAPGPAAVVFTGDHQVLTASFQPATAGFAAYHGPIRIDVAIGAGAESGTASFDVEYTPAAPATFTRTFREVLADGSLDLLVGLRVRTAGRYMLRGRVAGASGEVFAYVTFDGALAQGDVEAKLHLAGRLILDQGATAPFRLRDLEGFRLLEDTYPDRETMPGLDGEVFVTGRHPRTDFSDAAWESAEKDRRVKKLEQDLARAQRDVEH